MNHSFESFVAWRYLWEYRRQGRGLLVVAAILVVLAVGLRVVAQVWGQPVIDEIGLARRPIGRIATQASFACAVLAGLVLLYFALQRHFNVFTSVSIFGVFIGSAALVIVLSVMSGFEGDLRGKILGTHAHAVVRAKGRLLHDVGSILRSIRSLPGVVAAQPLVEGEVMVIGQGNQQIVLLKGIDPARAGTVTELDRYLHAECGAGKLEYLAQPDKLAAVSSSDKPKPPLPGVLVGCELAKNLRLYVGDDVRIASPRGGLGPMGPMPRTKAFRVAGIFYSGMYEYDTKIVYAAIEPAQGLLGLDDGVHGVEVKVRNPDRAWLVATQIAGSLGPSYEVKDWRELNRSLFSALKLEKIAMFVVLTFVVMVACFSIVTNLIMSVLQKGREIAIFLAMGVRGGALLRVFMIQGLYIGAIGTSLGLAVGVGACLWLIHYGLHLDPQVYYIATLPVNLDTSEIVAIALSGLALSVVATLYPAWMASRFKPVDGLRQP